MIYFYAQVENSTVVRVRIVSAAQVETEDGLDHSRATSLLAELHGVPEAQWVPCPFDGDGETTKVTPGFTFDPDKGTDGAFIPPKPFDSWVLDEGTCLWVAPVALPDDADTVAYAWDEEAGDWVTADEAV